MANPYQIEDWESMASVRSKLNQMGEVVENSIQNPSWWTSWQVLTKTATWTEWQDAKWWISSTTVTTIVTTTSLPSPADSHTLYFITA